MRRFLRSSSSVGAALAASVAACNIVSGAYLFEIGSEGSTPVPGEPDGSKPAGEAGPGDSGAREPDTGAEPVVDGGPGTKLVFVTSRQYRGNLGGIAGADLACQEAANAASIRAAGWRAWVSIGGIHAIDRIVHDGPYILRDGTRIANTKAELASGTLLSPIYRLENGQPAPTTSEEMRVWTGTAANGMSAGPDTCLGWTSESFLDFGVLGYLVSGDAAWTRAPGVVHVEGGWGCQTLGRLYCFEL